ncbi:MAG: cupin domain-containing protein [Gemmatimonadetes bacterium]|nr:cupin domain-containing protein [Gemmatimonadota bacterium]
MEKVNLREKLGRIEDHWHPRIVAEVSGMHVKLAKVKGEFDWHHHADEDELFWILSGRLLMQFRDREVWVEQGELIVVPKGVEHRPVAPEEVELALIEPVGTLHTGNVVTARTRTELEWI